MNYDVLQKIEKAAGFPFSEEQIKMITSFGKPLNIIACAGAGKTTIMIAKMFYMELEYHIRPSKMLVISFTRDSVKDIESRYNEMRSSMGLPHFQPKFSTFHSFYKYLLETDVTFQDKIIVNPSDYKYVLTKEVKYSGSEINTKSRIVDNILNYRGYLINNNLRLDTTPTELFHQNYNQYNYFFSPTDYFRVVQKYEELKAEDNAIDFDDLQLILKQKLESGDKTLKEIFKTSYTHVMIDEYQDISPIQEYITNTLMREIGMQNLTVIGDDDQCIYGFRGSDPKIIIDFEYRHTNAERLYLSSNFRCPQEILSFVAPVLDFTNDRVEKTLQTAKEGGEVRFANIKDNHDEFIDLLMETYNQVNNKKEIALIVRQNSLKMILADVLMRQGIPVDVHSENWLLMNNNFFKKMNDVVTAIKKSDNELFLQNYWIFAPHMKKDDLKQYKHNNQLWVIDYQDGRLDLPTYVGEVIDKLLWTDDAVEIYTLAFSLLEDHYKQGAKKGFYDLKEIMDTYEYTIRISQGKTLIELKNDMKEITRRLRSYIGKSNVLNIYTMHGVKGLEFKHVFVYQPVNRYLIKTKGDQILSEEARLFYVTCTRASETLTLVYDFTDSAKFVNYCKDKYLEGNKVEAVGFPEKMEYPKEQKQIKLNKKIELDDDPETVKKKLTLTSIGDFL